MGSSAWHMPFPSSWLGINGSDVCNDASRGPDCGDIGGQTCHGDIIELLDVSVCVILHLLEAWK
jgi:hypothetical protein